jgi:hypothetical protein
MSTKPIDYELEAKEEEEEVKLETPKRKREDIKLLVEKWHEINAMRNKVMAVIEGCEGDLERGHTRNRILNEHLREVELKIREEKYFQNCFVENPHRKREDIELLVEKWHEINTMRKEVMAVIQECEGDLERCHKRNRNLNERLREVELKIREEKYYQNCFVQNPQRLN